MGFAVPEEGNPRQAVGLVSPALRLGIYQTPTFHRTQMRDFQVLKISICLDVRQR